MIINLKWNRKLGRVATLASGILSTMDRQFYVPLNGKDATNWPVISGPPARAVGNYLSVSLYLCSSSLKDFTTPKPAPSQSLTFRLSNCGMAAVDKSRKSASQMKKETTLKIAKELGIMWGFHLKKLNLIMANCRK